MTALCRASVRAAFLAFTRPLEGSVSTMYVDTAKPRPLVTIGDGFLIDPVERALKVAFVRRDTGARATPDEIRAEWATIKHTPGLSKAGWRAAAKLCQLMITQETLLALTWQRFDDNCRDLARRYPGWSDWPAPAQLGVMSLAWAGGSGFEGEWPRCAAALRRGDFRAAATEATIPASPEREAKQQALLQAAAAVVERGADREVLYWSEDEVPAGVLLPSLEKEARAAQALAQLTDRRQLQDDITEAWRKGR